MSLLASIKAEKDICLGLARSYAPMESGNLRYNAIRTDDTMDGFAITYDSSRAFYIYFQEEGTRRSMKNAGFISNRTLPAIASYIQAKFADFDDDLIGYYETRALHGNYDEYKFSAGSGDKSAQEMIGLRAERLYASGTLNIDNVSSAYSWQHNTANEAYQTNLKQKF